MYRVVALMQPWTMPPQVHDRGILSSAMYAPRIHTHLPACRARWRPYSIGHHTMYLVGRFAVGLQGPLPFKGGVIIQSGLQALKVFPLSRQLAPHHISRVNDHLRQKLGVQQNIRLHALFGPPPSALTYFPAQPAGEGISLLQRASVIRGSPRQSVQICSDIWTPTIPGANLIHPMDHKTLAHGHKGIHLPFMFQQQHCRSIMRSLCPAKWLWPDAIEAYGSVPL